MSLNTFEMAIGKIYALKYFDKNSKFKVLEMSKNILEHFKKTLNETDWMDAGSKKAAKEKVT